MIVVTACVVAALAWAALFALPPSGFWTRALLVAPAMVGSAIGLRAAADRPYDWFGSVGAAGVAVGLGLAVVAWATVWWGYGPARRLVPWLGRSADELFALRQRASLPTVALATAATGIGEELLFRGVIQAEAGIVVATGVYTGVQLLSRNPLMIGLGLTGGVVWGGLYAVTGSLVPGVLAHVLPIGAVALVPPRDEPASDPPRP